VTDQHRNVVQADSEVFEKILNTWIPLHFDKRVGMPIARQEFLQAQGIGGELRTD
jgi:hypothetical protein